MPSFLTSLSKPATCVFLQWMRPVCRYLVVSESPSRPQYVTAGSFETEDTATLASSLMQHLQQQGVRPKSAVLLLPRGDFEVNTLTLPPAELDELPQLVHNLLAQQLDDGGASAVTDFLVKHRKRDNGTEVLTFSYHAGRLAERVQEFRLAKLPLACLTYSGFGAFQLLTQVSKHPARTSLVVTFSDHDMDLVVVTDGVPVLFRTFPHVTDNDSAEQVGRFTEQLGHEIQRTLSLVGSPDDDSTRVYLMGNVAEQEVAAQALSERLALSVSVVNPFDQLTANSEPTSQSSWFANLIGVACAWNHGQIELDMIHPKQPARNTSVWNRVGLWSAIAASLIGLAGYVQWQRYADQKSALLTETEKLQQLATRATKALEKQDVVDAINAWRADDIAWLDELLELTEKLPGADETLIRQMSMSSNPQPSGVVQLSVQVSGPEVVARLEDLLRDERHSVTSQRVSESPSAVTSTWQFDTRISFAPEKRPPLVAAAMPTLHAADLDQAGPQPEANAPPDREAPHE